jgi:hypothetical protein
VFDGVYRHFQQYFSYIVAVSYIMAVSFIGRGNQSNLEKTSDLPQVTDKMHNVISSTPRHGQDSNNFSGDRH